MRARGDDARRRDQVRHRLIAIALVAGCGAKERSERTPAGTVVIDWHAAVAGEERVALTTDVTLLAWDPPIQYALAIETASVGGRRAPVAIVAKVGTDVPFRIAAGDCGPRDDVVLCTLPGGGGFVVSGDGSARETTPRDLR